MNTYTISGNAFTGDDFEFENVEIVVENGIIKEICPKNKKSDRWIFPAFFNAHTHVADTVAMDTKVDRPLAELVSPPDGIKHKILNSTSDDVLARAISETLLFMKNTGTLGFADFREGGVNGAELLKKIVPKDMTSMIFGRDGGEFVSDGLGMSNAKGRAGEEKIVEEARKAGKFFAVHAGEADTKDIDTALSLEPDLIIHATNFSKKQIHEAADKNIPIVLCPRSNWILGVTNSAEKPPVKEMLEAGCTLYLGTDNVMFVEPNMFKECAFLHTVYRVDVNQVMNMATQGFSLAGIKNTIVEGNKANLTVLECPYENHWSRYPLQSVFMRSGKIRGTYSCLE
ncbi:MAG: amidohydrolase family protein [Methanocorpusculum sp.]|nr:amidohydrolase family protein [Methanocorpusculum sp.]